MKRLYVIVLLAAFIISCKPAPEPVFFQPANTTAVIVDTVTLDETMRLCNVSGSDYYVVEPFIFVHSEEADVVMTWQGTYKHDKTKDNWNLLPFLNRRDNVYWDSLAWIEAGKLGSGQDIACSETRDLPKVFDRFYRSYKPLYAKAQKPDINATEGM
jgi:hypothetical protein